MKKGRQQGFTLVECVIGLLVISLVMLSCYFVLRTTTRISRQQMNEPAAWYEFVNKLEGDNWQFKLDQVEPSHRRIKLFSLQNGERYELLVSSAGMIYLRKFVTKTHESGYLPLYGPVVTGGLNFKQLDDRRVKMEVSIRDHQKRQAVLCFAPPDG